MWKRKKARKKTGSHALEDEKDGYSTTTARVV